MQKENLKVELWRCLNTKCDILARPQNGLYEFTDLELRKLRSEGHDIAAEIWGEWKYADKKNMYKWLKENTATGHFGTMNKAQCREAIDKLFVKSFKPHYEQSRIKTQRIIHRLRRSWNCSG